MSREQFQNELNYGLSVKILLAMLDKGLITHDEYRRIDKLNRVSFSPELASIMS